MNEDIIMETLEEIQESELLAEVHEGGEVSEDTLAELSDGTGDDE